MASIDIIMDLLNEKGLKPVVLCKATGISQSLFSQWKSRQQNPSAAKLKLIADYFGVSIDYLSGNEDKKSPSSLDDRLRQLSPAKKKILNQLDQLEDEYLDLAIAQLELLINQQEKKNK